MTPRNRVDSDAVPARARLLRLVTAAGTAAVVFGSMVSSAPSGYAEPKTETLKQRLAKLSKRAEKLTKDYRGALVHLEDAKRAAKRAADEAKEARARRDGAARDVAQVAATRYATGNLGPLPMGGDPRTALDRAATLDYLAEQAQWKLRDFRKLQADADRAEADAQAKIEKVEQEIEQLEGRKDEVRALIARYEKQAREAARARAARARAAAAAAASASPSPTRDAGSGSDSGSGSTSDPDWIVSGSTNPGPCPTNITDRMCTVRNEIIRNFGTGPAIGCYRDGTWGEHPLGRACDFMLSSGGVMPSSTQIQRGHQISDWSIANAERLGIMYIIYRQRIWDIRCGCGWQAMEDRGSITANHYDHVHISVF